MIATPTAPLKTSPGANTCSENDDAPWSARIATSSSSTMITSRDERDAQQARGDRDPAEAQQRDDGDEDRRPHGPRQRDAEQVVRRAGREEGERAARRGGERVVAHERDVGGDQPGRPPEPVGDVRVERAGVAHVRDRPHVPEGEDEQRERREHEHARRPDPVPQREGDRHDRDDHRHRRRRRQHHERDVRRPEAALREAARVFAGSRSGDVRRRRVHDDRPWSFARRHRHPPSEN